MHHLKDIATVFHMDVHMRLPRHLQGDVTPGS